MKYVVTVEIETDTAPACLQDVVAGVFLSIRNRMGRDGFAPLYSDHFDINSMRIKCPGACPMAWPEPTLE